MVDIDKLLIEAKGKDDKEKIYFGELAYLRAINTMSLYFKHRDTSIAKSFVLTFIYRFADLNRGFNDKQIELICKMIDFQFDYYEEFYGYLHEEYETNFEDFYSFLKSKPTEAIIDDLFYIAALIISLKEKPIIGENEREYFNDIIKIVDRSSL